MRSCITKEMAVHIVLIKTIKLVFASVVFSIHFIMHNINETLFYSFKHIQPEMKHYE